MALFTRLGNFIEYAALCGMAVAHTIGLFSEYACLVVGLFSHDEVIFLSMRQSVVRLFSHNRAPFERWGAGVETQENVRGEIGGWGRVPFNEPYAPSWSTIYDGA